MTFQLLSSQVDHYREMGYLLLESHFAEDEINLLRLTAQNDRQLQSHAFGKSDRQGNDVPISVWNHPGNDIYGMFARCHRIVNAAEQILEDEPYHYHSKMIMKNAGTGAWEWHQDYGYWYNNGLLQPLLTSCFIAIDATTEENGCLQIVPRSHHLGRLDHHRTGQQAGIDRDRMRAILNIYPSKPILMQPGDVLFFHANLLHCSDQNGSTQPRWAMICCYNARSNSPYKEAHHPSYTPLERVSDSDILSLGSQGFSIDGSQTAWLQDAAHQESRTTPLPKRE